MVNNSLMTILERLEDALIHAEYHELNIHEKPQVTLSFKQRRMQSHQSTINSSMQLLDSRSFELLSNVSTRSRKDALQFLALSQNLSEAYQKKDVKEMLVQIHRMKSVLPRISTEKVSELKIKKPNLPPEIKDEVHADLDELQKCFNTQSYRSVVILCGRVLEAALHRKYYETTNFDILEKNPGIGLGTLIAKLVDKGVDLDPGLTQQIHLINNVRIFSVHKKLKPFHPSRAQAHAIVLFTLDTLEKLF